MKHPFWITTSWDDGHLLDLRVADCLEQHGLTGTFYICRDYLTERLSESQIAQLATRHEIGAHTLTHPELTELEPASARREIVKSRLWLERVTGAPVTAFCYPKGRSNPALRAMVREAGYTVARTVLQYQLHLGDDPYDIPTTLHIYPFPLEPSTGIRGRFEPLRRISPHLRHLRIPITSLRNWSAMATALLKTASETGGVWHLWGHSWEIEKYGMWGALNHLLKAASKYQQAKIVTNSELVRAFAVR
ncbi:MAG: polysaccharide deacetylase family protein [Acidobacteriota bacterium]